MSNIVTSDGYSIFFYKNENKIVITLPQTEQTITNTINKISKRKQNMTHTDTILLLNIIKYIFEGDKLGQ